MTYYIETRVDKPFDTVVESTIASLAEAGFGVLSDIDVAATLKKKLGVERTPYRILGACNPKLAFQAISAVEDIGLLLPCNVLVREDDKARVHVDFMDPESVLSLVGDTRVAPLAADVKGRLERVLAAV